MLHYFATTIGKVVVKQHDKKYTIQIRRGNCLAVLIHSRKATSEELEKHPEGRYIHTLYTFFADERHIKNLMRDTGTALGDDVVGVELNMYYKENYTLLKYFVKSGYKVKCYYKEKK